MIRILLKNGVNSLLIEKTELFKVFFTDEDGNEFFSIHKTKEEAQNEAYDDECIEKFNGYQPTDLMTSKLDVFTDVNTYYDHLVILFAKENISNIDGVWFDDNYDPINLSLPRGLIFNDCINTWEILKNKKEYTFKK